MFKKSLCNEFSMMFVNALTFVNTCNFPYVLCSGTALNIFLIVTNLLLQFWTAAMPHLPSVVMHRRMETLIATNIKSFLNATRRKCSTMDNAGRKLLLSIILKNTGIHTPFHLACVQVLLITIIFCSKPSPNNRYTTLLSTPVCRVPRDWL